MSNRGTLREAIAILGYYVILAAAHGLALVVPIVLWLRPEKIASRDQDSWVAPRSAAKRASSSLSKMSSPSELAGERPNTALADNRPAVA